MELGRDRAGGPGQIEMALKNIPQISHISGHMGSTGFDPEVVKLMRRLSEEYHLPVVDRRGDAGIRFHLFRV